MTTSFKQTRSPINALVMRFGGRGGGIATMGLGITLIAMAIRDKDYSNIPEACFAFFLGLSQYSSAVERKRERDMMVNIGADSIINNPNVPNCSSDAAVNHEIETRRLASPGVRDGTEDDSLKLTLR